MQLFAAYFRDDLSFLSFLLHPRYGDLVGRYDDTHVMIFVRFFLVPMLDSSCFPRNSLIPTSFAIFGRLSNRLVIRLRLLKHNDYFPKIELCLLYILQYYIVH